MTFHISHFFLRCVAVPLVSQVKTVDTIEFEAPLACFMTVPEANADNMADLFIAVELVGSTAVNGEVRNQHTHV